MKNIGKKIERHKFCSSKMALKQGITLFDVFDDDINLRPDWRVVGWNDAEMLMLLGNRYDDELPYHEKWVAVLYEKENGEQVWFHTPTERRLVDPTWTPPPPCAECGKIGSHEETCDQWSG
jgi:hypothetical protein